MTKTMGISLTEPSISMERSLLTVSEDIINANKINDIVDEDIHKAMCKIKLSTCGWHLVPLDPALWRLVLCN